MLIALVWFFGIRTSYAPLFSNMRTVDAATMISELDRQKIPYRLADGGTTVLVPQDKADATRLAVMGEDLPLKGTVGFELFNKSEMGLTDFAQKINYQRALQGELARTIMTLEGVDAARVHLSLGEDRIFREDRVAPKASVTVRMRDGIKLSDNSTQGIQRLVAAAVPKLELAEVVVLDERGEVVSAAPSSAANALMSTPLAQERQAIANYYEAKLRALLDQRYPGQSIEISVGLGLLAGNNDEGSPLPAWNPDARAFPLHLVIDPASTLDGNAMQDMRDVAAGAIGFDATLGDDIRFGHVAPELAPQSEPKRTIASYVRGNVASVAPSPHTAPSIGLEEVAGIALLLLVGALLGWRLLWRPTSGARATRDFADQLRTALIAEGGHVQDI